jgi:RNA-directed DNA polymerase
MRLSTPIKIQELQRKLYLKAKQEPTYRFYALYDKVYRLDILAHAYLLSKANKGKSGVDGQEFEDIESYGRERFLVKIQEELREEKYKPEAVRRVMIPKADGGERPLGIPTIKDRVVQTAAKLILESIFEADLTDNAYAYRPGRGAQEAIREVHAALKTGYTQVVDADISKYFDTIPHAELMRSVARRISDGRMLHLVKMWLKVPVEERNDNGKRVRKSAGNLGTPQGGVISPILANIYMRRFLKAWERGYEQKLKARIVNYADDFVILCRQNAEGVQAKANAILTHIGLALNEKKTRTCHIWQDSFDFLGYTFGTQYAFGGGRKYIGAYPSRKSIKRFKDMLRKMTGSWSRRESAQRRVGAINNRISKWTNYFDYGSRHKVFDKLEKFIQLRVRQWLIRKHKVGSRGERRFPAKYLYNNLGLFYIQGVLSKR